MINSAQGESEAFPAEVISVDPSRVSEELLGRQEVGGQRVRDRVGERALQAQETAQALACAGRKFGGCQEQYGYTWENICKGR